MKIIATAVVALLLSGCNSSKNSDVDTIPPKHLPEINVPERPHPDVPPSHLPGDMPPDRPSPGWYQEASTRYGMTVAALHTACSFKGTNPQVIAESYCLWENEKVTVVYYASRELGEENMYLTHSFKWVIDDHNIDQGYIWPSTNHIATGLVGSETYIDEGVTNYTLRICKSVKCNGQQSALITHDINSTYHDKNVLSDGTPLNGGNTYFNMEAYKLTEAFVFNTVFTDVKTNEKTRSQVVMEEKYPAIIYDVLSPAFGY